MAFRSRLRTSFSSPVWLYLQDGSQPVFQSALRCLSWNYYSPCSSTRSAMFLILPRTWLGIYGTILLLSCSDFVISTKELELRATIPAPIVIPASQDWWVPSHCQLPHQKKLRILIDIRDGSDGPWSSFIGMKSPLMRSCCPILFKH